jgi:hypothetical protein
MDKNDIKNLQKRYLLWLYKNTKEALDKIERKFTQLDIDRFILKELEAGNHKKDLDKFILEFKAYIQSKEEDGLKLKYEGKNIKANYQFLFLKLRAIEKAIVKELGRPVLYKIKDAYEKEMLKRIIEDRQEKL